MAIGYARFAESIPRHQYNKIKLLNTQANLMNTHHIETTITENGKLSLQNLPFKKGDELTSSPG